MNIRDFIFINKAKSTDRIKILELLGFETETVISHAPEAYVDSNEEVDVDNFELYLDENNDQKQIVNTESISCLLYTSPSPRDRTRSRMPSSA